MTTNLRMELFEALVPGRPAQRPRGHLQEEEVQRGLDIPVPRQGVQEGGRDTTEDVVPETVQLGYSEEKLDQPTNFIVITIISKQTEYSEHSSDNHRN